MTMTGFMFAGATIAFGLLSAYTEFSFIIGAGNPLP
jgi:hypothetical protein